jgi:hypothetical protein
LGVERLAFIQANGGIIVSATRSTGKEKRIIYEESLQCDMHD